MSANTIPALASELLTRGKDSLVGPATLLLALLKRRSRETVIDQWQQFIEEFHMEPLEFYALVHEELKRRNVPGLKTFCVTHGEGGIGSAERLYLRLERNWGHFDICAAPFGTGFFFSYRYIVPTPLGMWLKVFAGLLFIAAGGVALTLTGILSWAHGIVASCLVAALWLIALWTSSKDTYYRQDTSMMYLSTVPHVIKSLFETVTLKHGARLEERLSAAGARA